MRRALLLTATIASICGLARAQTPGATNPEDIALAAAPASKPNVSVTVGQALQLKVNDYGQSDIAQLTNDLASTVGRALARSKSSPPLRIKLILEDATPTRPTATQLGRTAGLSERSIGLGGAWIDGYVLTLDNKQIPISYSFYETDLRNELGPAMWSDASRAFDQLAEQLARGKFPKQGAPDVPQQSFAHWPR